MRIILLFLLFSAAALAQRASGVVVVFADPTGGVCPYNSPMRYYSPPNEYFGCVLANSVALTGIWTLVSSGGTGGTVTSVDFSTNLGAVSGNPITTSGTITNTVAAADVVNLFTGCSGTQYLGADGACHTAGTGSVTSIATSNGITGGTITTTGTISGINAAADGSTKGVAAFTGSDFDSSSGVISLDYTNGQKASGSQPGFLSSTDWTTFNGKGSGTVTSIATTSPIGGGPITSTGTITCTTCVVTSRTIGTTSPITGGGDLSSDLTIACATCITSSSGGGGSGFYPSATYGTFTDPTLTSFSWRNQGTATITTNGASLYLAAAASASTSIKGREIAEGATPFSITSAFLPQLTAASNDAGLYVTDGTKLVQFVLLSSGGVQFLQVNYYTNVTTYSSTPCSVSGIFVASPFWMKIRDDGTTNLVFSYSQTGLPGSFTTFCTVARLAFLASVADMGFQVDSQSSTYGVSMTVMSFAAGS